MIIRLTLSSIYFAFDIPNSVYDFQNKMIEGKIMAVDSNHVAYFDVHAIQDAKPDDLKKLGLSLSELCIKFPAITATGIDELLTGNYPQPIETFFWTGKISDTINGKADEGSIPTPWIYCFARVSSPIQLISEQNLLNILQDHIPDQLGAISEPSREYF